MDITGTNGQAYLTLLGASGSTSATSFLSSIGTAPAPSATNSRFGPSTLPGRGESFAPAFIADYSALLGAALQAQLSPASAQPPSKAEVATIRQVVALSDENKFAEAEALLDRLERGGGKSGYTTHARGVIALERKDFVLAEKLFNRAAQTAPGNGFEADAENARLLQLDGARVISAAKRLLVSDDTREQGVRLLVNYTDAYPDATEARTLLAETVLADGDATTALIQYGVAIGSATEGELRTITDRLEQLAEAAPKAVFLRNLLGRAQVRLGRNDEAAATFDAAIAISEDDDDKDARAGKARALLGQGREALDRGFTREAITLFEQARALAPADGAVREGLAEGYLARGDARARDNDLTRAISDYRDAAGALFSSENQTLRAAIATRAFSAGTRLERRNLALGNDVGQEVVAFQAAYDIDPENRTYAARLASVRNRLGEQYLVDGEYEDAAASFRRAYDLARGNATYKTNAINAYQQWGDARAAQADWTGAIDAYREAYTLNTSDDGSRSRLANAYFTRAQYASADENYAAAAADYREALQLYPDNATYQAAYDAVAAHLGT